MKARFSVFALLTPLLLLVAAPATVVAQPVFQVSAGSINFGHSGVSASGINNKVNLVISNTGNATLNLLSTPVFQGPNSGDFVVCVQLQDNCTTFEFSWPTSIPAGGSFTAPIAFQPTATGTRTGQLVFTTDAAGSPQMVQLQGDGLALAVAPPSGAATTATIPAGQSAAFNVVVSTALTSTVTVTCTGAPAAATCIPNPSSASITTVGGSSIPVTVTAFTTARSSAVFMEIPPAIWWSLAAVWAIMLVARSKRLRRPVLIATATVLLLSSVVSCGGGSSGGGGGGGTPAGTYTLTVSANTAGGSDSMSLTLTVQ